MTLLDQITTAAIGLAAALGGAIGKAVYDARTKRVEATATVAQATSAADATGRHEVRKAEIADRAQLVGELWKRLDLIELERKADRAACALELAGMRRQLDAMQAKLDEAETRADRAEAQAEALAGELAEVMRALHR